MTAERVPILRVDVILLVTLQGDLDDATVLRLEEELTHEVARRRTRGALIDLSGLPVVDSFMARVIGRIASLVRLMGVEIVVVGIQPALAVTMVELGVDLRHVRTALNAGKGMALLRRLGDL